MSEITSPRWLPGGEWTTVKFDVGDKVLFDSVRAGQIKAVITEINPNVYPEITLRVTSRNVPAYPTGYRISTSPSFLHARPVTEYIVQTYTSYGWEDETFEISKLEARARLAEYRDNQPDMPHRLITRRPR